MEYERILKNKKYLNSYKEICKRVRRLEWALKEIMTSQILPRIPRDNMPHTKSYSDLSNYMIKIEKEEKKLEKAKYKRICLFMEIKNNIEIMQDDDEKDVLMLRYLKLMSWEKIEEELSFSHSYIHKIHSRALKNFNRRQKEIE